MKWRSLLLIGALGLLAGAANAASISIPFNLYGHVEQHEITGCNSGDDFESNSACGPTAVLNSLIMLQNKYPDVYNEADGTELVHPGDEVIAGNTIACYSSCGDDGTTTQQIIDGKRGYLNQVAPGTTMIKTQSIFDPKNPIYPTFNFLFTELKHGEDVELLIGWYRFSVNDDECPTPGVACLWRSGGHWITLNGITWNDTNNNNQIDDGEGSFDFIDPWNDNHVDGAFDALDYDDQGMFRAGDGSLRIPGKALDPGNYGPNGVTVAIVESAVTESPVPEPGTWMLLASGAGLIALARRRRRA